MSADLSTPVTQHIGKLTQLSEHTIELSGEHIVWLNIMRERYNHIDINQTLSILLYYCRTYTDQRFIYSKIRCRSCGRKFDKPSIHINIQQYLIDYSQQQIIQYNIPTLGKLFRIIIDYAQEGRQIRGSSDAQKAAIINKLEYDIFAVKHCTHVVVCDSGGCINSSV